MQIVKGKTVLLKDGCAFGMKQLTVSNSEILPSGKILDKYTKLYVEQGYTDYERMTRKNRHACKFTDYVFYNINQPVTIDDCKVYIEDTIYDGGVGDKFAGDLNSNVVANSVPFTVEVLKKLSDFISSDMVEEKEWFSDYDKQAIKDSVIYLKWLGGSKF